MLSVVLMLANACNSPAAAAAAGHHAHKNVQKKVERLKRRKKGRDTMVHPRRRPYQKCHQMGWRDFHTTTAALELARLVQAKREGVPARTVRRRP